MGALKTLLVLGGAGLAINELANNNSSRSANIPKPATKPTLDTQAVKKAIQEDPNLMALVRGEKGDAGTGYKATSTSSTAIATGSKTFDVGSANLAYSVGARVRVTATTDVAKFMEGVVTAYSGTTLTVLVDLIGGTGTLASWNVNVSGEKGITGTTGAAGDTIVHYCGSLLRNGSLELNTLENWTGGVIGSGTFEGMNILENAGATTTNTNLFYVRPDRLYKFETYVKGTGAVSFVMTSFAKDGVTQLLKSNSSSTTYFLQSITPASSSTFEKKVGYAGGLGILGTNFPDNVVKAKFAISTASSVGVAKVVVKEVPLGEPVPYNLAFLPTGQMVVDPTTSEVGYYNGTAVVWFAA